MLKQWPPLNVLRGFEAAARLGSFHKAADELHLTQSAISPVSYTHLTLPTNREV